MPLLDIKISPIGGSIVAVTGDVIAYRTADGTRGRIRLAEFEADHNPEYVGYRNLKRPPYWVRVGDVWFEFESAQAAYDELLDPLYSVGKSAPKEPLFDIAEDSWWNVALAVGAVAFAWGCVWVLNLAMPESRSYHTTLAWLGSAWVLGLMAPFLAKKWRNRT